MAPKKPVLPVDKKPIDVSPEKTIVDPNTAEVHKQLLEYKILCEASDNEENMRLRVRQFNKIIRFALYSESEMVLDHLLEFFTKERHGLMSEKRALVLTRSLSKVDRDIYGSFYAVLAELVDCKKSGKAFILKLENINKAIPYKHVMSFIARHIR